MGTRNLSPAEGLPAFPAKSAPLACAADARSTRTAPTDAAIRKLQDTAAAFGSTGAIQRTAARSTRINNPTHLNPRRVFVVICGSRPHTVHTQRFQNPAGRIGIQKM